MKNQHEINNCIDWYKAVQKTIRSLSNITQEHNISFEQFLLLDIIIVKPELTPSKIGELMNTSAPAVSRKLNALKDKGFIRKIRGEGSDQRRVEIQLTDKGGKIYSTIKRCFSNSSLVFNFEQAHWD